MKYCKKESKFERNAAVVNTKLPSAEPTGVRLISV